MPIYEYVCEDCGTRYEQLVMTKRTKIACPKCSSPKHALQLSVFSTSGKSNAESNGTSASGSACGCIPRTCGCG